MTHDPETNPCIRVWTKDEDNVLRGVYPSGGINACAEALSHRSLESIRKRVSVLQVKRDIHRPSLIESPRDALIRKLKAAEDEHRESGKKLSIVHREFAAFMTLHARDINHQRKVS